MEGILRDDTMESCMQKDGSGRSSVSGILTPKDLHSLVSRPSPVDRELVDVPFVRKIHISSKSDIFRGKASTYAGVIVYFYDGKSRWETVNGTRCESGYLVVMETESEKVKMHHQQSRSEIHHAVYQSAFGEQCIERNLDAVGFSVTNGVFEINPSVFRSVEAGFHGDERPMRSLLALCIGKEVQHWMNAREHFYLRCRNFMGEDLIRDSTSLPGLHSHPTSASCTTFESTGSSKVHRSNGKASGSDVKCNKHLQPYTV